MFRALRSSFLILTLSRAIGVSRELLIALAFGFSVTTDRFYQATFPITCVISIMTGPFTTAFAARLATQQLELRRAQISQVTVKVYRIAATGFGLSLLAALLLWVQPVALYKSLAVPVAVLSPAVAAAIIVGFASAVSTSAGKLSAATIGYLTANAAFLTLSAIAWLVVSTPANWLLPLCYALAMTIALWPATAITGAFRRAQPAIPAGAAERLPVPGLARSFVFALLEAGGFLLTQLVVLVISSSQGAGVASAAALSQRLVLSIVGLFILPFAILVMLRMVEDASNARRIFLHNLSLLLLILLGANGAIILVGSIGGKYVLPEGSAALLTSLLPPFAIWALPIGVTAFLSRVMFGMGLDRPFTVTAVSGYLVANLMRIIVWHFGGLSTAVLIGALVEVAISLTLVVITLQRLKLKGVNAT